MNIKNLFTDDDAVSPVIGVILMVAITVILAAVIGAFVLDLGGSQEKAPSASFDWDQSAEADGTNTITVTVTHESGESIPDQNVDITSSTIGSVKFGEEVNAGTSKDLSYAFSSGEEIRVIWTSDSGETSSTISSYTVN